MWTIILEHFKHTYFVQQVSDNVVKNLTNTIFLMAMTYNFLTVLNVYFVVNI